MTHGKVLKLVLSYLLTFLILPTHTENIDTDYPIIITNSADGANSHFGASTVLVPGTEPA